MIISLIWMSVFIPVNYSENYKMSSAKINFQKMKVMLNSFPNAMMYNATDRNI